MKRFSLAIALVLVSVFISVSSLAHGGGDEDHQNMTLASAVMNGIDDTQTTEYAQNKAALKNFVMHAKEHIREAEHIEDLLLLLTEFRDKEGDWIAHEDSIYLYMFTDVSSDAHEELVVFHAINFDVEGLDLHGMRDANGDEIAHKLIRAIGGDGFAKYTWDDPRFEGDEVTEAGRSPGSSPKVGYVEKVTLLEDPATFLIGSGFYPTPYSPASDNGCAIAGGTTGRDGLSSLFNLFLMVSALFLAVSWKTRTVKR